MNASEFYKENLAEIVETIGGISFKYYEVDAYIYYIYRDWLFEERAEDGTSCGSDIIRDNAILEDDLAIALIEQKIARWLFERGVFIGIDNWLAMNRNPATGYFVQKKGLYLRDNGEWQHRRSFFETYPVALLAALRAMKGK